MTISCEQIRAYAAAHPDDRHVDVARALGIAPARCYNAMRTRGGRPPSTDYPERRKKLLPMLPGEGDRHDDCQRYDACLTRAAIVGGDAHCPEVCSSFAAVPAEVRRTIALTVPRESRSDVAVYLRGSTW